MKTENGFSILEFVVSILIITIIFAIVFQMFLPVAKSAKIESANIQTQIEGIIGLETLRRDVVHAGVGLPWTIESGITYTETSVTPQNAYNETANTAPRPVIAVDGSDTPPVGVAGSDYLILKSTVLGDIIQTGNDSVANPVGDRWTSVYWNGDDPAHGKVRLWNATGTTERDPQTNDRVLVLQPSSVSGPFLLKKGSTNFFTTVGAANPKIDTGYEPTVTTEVWYAYGIRSGADPNMPFYRADYYIDTANRPARCAVGASNSDPGTGVLVKRLLKQDKNFADPIPLLDCVADFQVVIGVDNTANEINQRNCIINPTSANLASATVFPSGLPNNATAIRSEFKEIRIYILAQEGTFDLQYNYPNPNIIVGEDTTATGELCNAPGGGTQTCNCSLSAGAGDDRYIGRQSFDLTKIRNYKNYRWRLYKLSIKPEGLTATSTQ